MKKIALLAVFLLAIGLVAGVAEDKPLTLSGSVSFSIGDNDVAVAPGPAFAGAKAGAVASFKLGTSSDKVEAGVTIGLVPNVAWTDAVAADPGIVTLGSGTGYKYIQKIMDWHWYKMSGKTYKDDAGATQTFAAINFAAVAYNSAGAITGAGPYAIADSADIVWTATKSKLIQDDYIAIVKAVATDGATGQIEAMSVRYDIATGVILDGTAAEVAAAQGEDTMYADYYAYAYGADAAAYNTASLPVTNAYLKVKKIAGVVDIMAEVNGKAVGVGSMVTSSATSGNAANFGVSLALSEGVVAGLSASALVTGSNADMAAAVSEDITTAAYEGTVAAVEPVWGTQVEVGYATKMFGAKVQFGVVDLMATTFAWQASIQPFVSLADIAGLSVKGEFNLVSGTPIAMAAGASVGASIMGIAPSVGFYWKDANFGGDGSIDGASDADTITTDGGLMAEFNSIDNVSAAALSLGVAVDLSGLIGMKLVTLSGGYDMMLIGGNENGWKAGVGFDLAEVLKAPLTLSFDVSKWAANDLLWSAGVGYTYDKLGVTFSLKQTAADVIGWSLAGKVSF